MPADLVPDEASSWLSKLFFSLCPHMAEGQSETERRIHCAVSCKNTHPIGRGPHPYDLTILTTSL